MSRVPVYAVCKRQCRVFTSSFGEIGQRHFSQPSICSILVLNIIIVVFRRAYFGGRCNVPQNMGHLPLPDLLKLFRTSEYAVQFRPTPRLSTNVLFGLGTDCILHCICLCLFYWSSVFNPRQRWWHSWLGLKALLGILSDARRYEAPLPLIPALQ